jgi:hypothetical protein
LILSESTYARCVLAAQASLAGAPDKRAEDVAIYLAHVEGAASLRRLAEASGRPATSVHRAIRRIEALRDDPLLDIAFDQMGDAARRLLSDQEFSRDDIMQNAALQARAPTGESGSAYQLRVAARTLERLSEPEAFMMVAKGAEKAGVFSRKNRFRRPVALLTVEAAADLAARDWVRSVSRTAMSAKYAISDAGRAWLRRRLAEEAAEAASAVPGREGPSPFAAQHRVEGQRVLAKADGGVETVRVNMGESPLGWLASRKGADGTPFLTSEEVEAGERLRTDFEAAQMGPRVTQDWRSFLSPRDGRSGPSAPSEGPMFARDRLASALKDLGPGLADVALRACCYLEGLEATERSMGWSARSGKVVLKIALQRLALHYGLASGA